MEGTAIKSVPFLSEDQVRYIERNFGTPVYVYDQETLTSQAQQILNFPNAFGLTARFAMKACSTRAVLKVLTTAGLHIDASSGYEVERALRAGISPENIQLTAQEAPANLKELVNQGIRYNACSLAQIEAFGRACPNGALSIRVNPGLGSGHSNRTNVGGPSAAFGIWYAYLERAQQLGRKYGLRFTGLHTHIGSGSDPAVWRQVALMSLEICSQLPDVTVLNLGGGFKVGRVEGEISTDIQCVGLPIAEAFQSFYAQHGRKLRLEVEPGTFLMANSGVLITKAIDVIDTGTDGYNFIKINAGMTEIIRPSMYGAQHPIEVVPCDAAIRGQKEYVVVGHCCESGDVLTPAPGEPEQLLPRLLTDTHIGDLVVIGGAGAYCSSMSARNYNSFPDAPEVMIFANGAIELIRKRQTLSQVLQNELEPESLRAIVDNQVHTVAGSR